VATALAALVVLDVAPAFAGYHPDDGEVHGPSLGTGMLVLLYVVIPVGAFLVIAALSVLPSALRRPRYRPGRPWNHDPMWFRGPDDPESALASARPGATARGGASAEY
jgi:hypothetical protein